MENAQSSDLITRRKVLTRGAQTAGALWLLGGLPRMLTGQPPAYAAPRSHDTRGALQPVMVQLNYEENIQFAGDFIALDRGYYAAEGFAVTLLPGGPNIAPEPIVVSGKALIGITHTVEALQAIVSGAPLKIIGAGYQKNPFCMISSAAHPIRTPEDMYGKRIGVSATNTPVWDDFVKAAKLDVSKIHVVAVTFDITPLAAGSIDGLMGFYTNEPILLAARGFKPYVWLFADFGYPLMEEVYIVREADLASASGRARLVRFMTAESKGWAAQVANPALGARLAALKYGKNLHLVLSEQIAAAKAQNRLVADADTAKYGLFWMTPKLVSETVRSARIGGVQAKESMFTNEILAEVYHRS
jgi:ABC-type nitrate/sulfonate/bicarbonate transport system substrate-binding protein